MLLYWVYFLYHIGRFRVPLPSLYDIENKPNIIAFMLYIKNMAKKMIWNQVNNKRTVRFNVGYMTHKITR